MKPYINRKRFVVYKPNYKPGDGYKIVYSWFQAIKLCKKWGIGSQICVDRLKGGTRIGRLSFWNTEEVFEWV